MEEKLKDIVKKARGGEKEEQQREKTEENIRLTTTENERVFNPICPGWGYIMSPPLLVF